MLYGNFHIGQHFQGAECWKVRLSTCSNVTLFFYYFRSRGLASNSSTSTTDPGDLLPKGFVIALVVVSTLLMWLKWPARRTPKQLASPPGHQHAYGPPSHSSFWNGLCHCRHLLNHYSNGSSPRQLTILSLCSQVLWQTPHHSKKGWHHFKRMRMRTKYQVAGLVTVKLY
jgi:hypothetical protein